MTRKYSDYNYEDRCSDVKYKKDYSDSCCEEEWSDRHCDDKSSDCDCHDKCDCDGGNECRFTLAEILSFIKRCAPETLVTAYLNVPGTVRATSTVRSINLSVNGNANVSVTIPEGTQVNVSGRANFQTGAINITSTGNITVPASNVAVATAATQAPVSVTSGGVASIDNLSATGRVNIPALGVTGNTAATTTPLVIDQTGGPAPIPRSGPGIEPDTVDIPELGVCCRACSDGTSTCSGGTREICGCMQFHTQEQSVEVNLGEEDYFVNLTNNLTARSADQPENSGRATIPSTSLTGLTAPYNANVNVSGSATGTVSVVGEGTVNIPRLTGTGTVGPQTVPVTTTGSNTAASSANLTATGSLSRVTATGTAATNGLPVRGTIGIDTSINEEPVRFTGTVEFVDCNTLVLKEEATGKKIVLSLCDILKITFSGFRGINSMSKLFDCEDIDKGSCAFGIQKRLKADKCKSGTIQLYGSSTNNPISGEINTRNILLADCGVLWIVNKDECKCTNNTVYSICNLAGYAFTGSSHQPCPPCH